MVLFGSSIFTRSNAVIISPCKMENSARVLRYVPSKWEKDWRENIVLYQSDPCVPMLETKGAQQAASFLRRLKNQNIFLGDYHDMNDFPDPIFSYFVIQIGKEEIKVAIEPLVGFFRHPYAIVECVPEGESQVDGLDLSYIIFRGMSIDQFNYMYPGRKFLFDLGINGPNRSLEWLYDEYRKFGIELDEIWGWEKRTLEPNEFWTDVPETVYPKLHFMNIPVTENPSDRSHPFQVIKEIYRPGDYIALKLDIDSPGYEQGLADQLLHDEELSHMIADFYYEKHFGAKYFPYHGITQDDPVHNMKSVMDFFTNLREKGIRAHYWV